MIDENEQDQAIQYVLGNIAGEEARNFAMLLEVDAQLAAFVNEMRETSTALAQSVPQQTPPPQLRARVLAMARGETIALKPPPEAEATNIAELPTTILRAPSFGWLPWAIAASLAVTSGFLWLDRLHLQQEIEAQATQLRVGALAKEAGASQQAEIIDKYRKMALAAQQETVKARNDITALEAEAKIFQDRDLALQKQIKDLKGQDALAQVTIATLSAQVGAYAKAGVTVVWDAAQQRGVVKLDNLPPAAAGKDYQLWVIDPKYPAPVNGGVVHVNRDGFTRVDFHPDQPVASAEKFAISVEASGGVAKAAGPIIFLGN